MRGKARDSVQFRLQSGITPAYAGKRKSRRIIGVRLRDHPRLCGEKEFLKNGRETLVGSPPPMRGKVAMYSCFCISSWITPAYAGKSSL